MNQCCENEDNLKVEPTEKPELVMKRCQVCKARHFRLLWQPITIGVSGTALGGN